MLAEHTEGFPRILLGRKTLLAHMGGMQIKWNEEEKIVQVGFGRWPGKVGECTDQVGKAAEPSQVCVMEVDRVGMIMEDQHGEIDAGKVAEWVTRASHEEEICGENPRDNPQSRAFSREEDHTAVLVNPENECEAGEEWIEDCPTPTVMVTLDGYQW